MTIYNLQLKRSSNDFGDLFLYIASCISAIQHPLYGRGLGRLPYRQAVTPSVVAIAVKIAMTV